jgi:phosphocarrier protein FPr
VIGIVVVSHSRALADAAVGLATEMVEESRRPPVRVAAGLGETTFGTDAGAVAAAIEEVDGPEGVLVLLDLGSAVLSAEMALEFLDPDTVQRVTVSSAPLVEGLVAAMVTASTGAPLDAVVEEARQGLLAKQDHLGDAAPAPSGGVEPEPADSATAVSDELAVSNEHGLHARPAAKLVALVRGFEAEVRLTNLRTGHGPVDARSLSKVATLDARKGDRVRVVVSGAQAEQALEAVRGLAAEGWGDEPAASAEAPPAVASARRTGSGLDVAMGPAVVADHEVDTTAYEPGDPDEEQRRSDAAVGRSLAELAELTKHTHDAAGAEAAMVFEAHRALLEDPDLIAEVQQDIAAGTSAVGSWEQRLSAVEAEFEALPDPYQRERAQDVRSVRRRVTAALVGADPVDTAEAAGILVVPELDAATAALVDVDLVTGIVTEAGGATGHGVIVARSRGIPIITDMGEPASAIRSGVLVAFDARARRLEVAPDDRVQAEFRRLIEARGAARGTALETAAEPATTTDGHRILVEANVTSVDDALSARSQGADGSGLVRTEILFGHDASMPSVETQVAAFTAVAEAFDGLPITIRTWDVGGDKPLPFLPQPAEANPFLGERGLRLVRRAPEVPQAQLKAVCRVAVKHRVNVMFPMVTTAAEVAWARQQLEAAARETSGAVPTGLRVGIMVEVPAAAVRVRQVAAGLDFVSIGTNDLTQYTTAAERGNAAVASLADACDPAVLELIHKVCTEVDAGTAVAVCGDLASDPDAAVLLVGLGVRELSAVAAQVPLVKARLREVSLADAQSLAEAALQCGSAAEVRELIAGGGQRTPQE